MNILAFIRHRIKRIVGSELFHTSIHEYLGNVVVTDSIMCPCFFYQEYWILNSPMQTTIILLVEQIVTALGGEFKVS